MDRHCTRDQGRTSDVLREKGQRGGATVAIPRLLDGSQGARKMQEERGQVLDTVPATNRKRTTGVKHCVNTMRMKPTNMVEVLVCLEDQNASREAQKQAAPQS